MCLTRPDKSIKPIKVGYKACEKSVFGTIHSPVIRTQTYTVGKVETSTESGDHDWLLDYENLSGSYPMGFHVFHKKADAVSYSESFNENGTTPCIIKVGVIEPLATGLQKAKLYTLDSKEVACTVCRKVRVLGIVTD